MTSPALPPLEWPALPDHDDDAARLAWYRDVVAAYADLWAGHASQPPFAPATGQAVAATEARLACALPAALRRYHLEIGALNLAETLCAPQADATVSIEPLFDAYPGIVERGLSEADTRLARQLIVFGDYLGNGNLFCFHRESGAVYYFDHDTDPALTPFSPDVRGYLDALMMRSLAEVHDDDAAGEARLIERLGRPLVRKWLY